MQRSFRLSGAYPGALTDSRGQSEANGVEGKIEERAKANVEVEIKNLEKRFLLQRNFFMIFACVGILLFNFIFLGSAPTHAGECKKQDCKCELTVTVTKSLKKENGFIKYVDFWWTHELRCSACPADRDDLRTKVNIYRKTGGGKRGAMVYEGILIDIDVTVDLETKGKDNQIKEGWIEVSCTGDCGNSKSADLPKEKKEKRF